MSPSSRRRCVPRQLTALTLLLTAFASLLGASAAQAASVLDGGTEPHAVSDPDGTAHVAWLAFTGGTKVARYCRIAVGASTCDVKRDFSLGTDPGPSVNIVRNPATGAITVLGNRCCEVNDTVVTWTSTDRGATFGTAKSITAAGSYGDYDIVQAVAGPGQFSISMLRNTPNTNLQIASTNTGSPTTSRLSSMMTASAFVGLALVDQNTPLVTAVDAGGVEDATSPFRWRRWLGTGDVRSLATWTAEKSAPILHNARLSGNGVGSPIAVGMEGTYRDQRVVLRRYNREANDFSAVSVVTEDETPSFPGVYLDGASQAHVTYDVKNPDTGDSELMYKASADGVTWPATPIVLTTGQDAATRPAMATGLDGAGVAVWTRGNAGGQTDDQIVLGRIPGPAGFPPPVAVPPPSVPGAPPGAPPVDPSCVKTPTLGIAKLLATECFRSAGGTKLSTTAPFLVNGVTVEPNGQKVTIDTAKRTLTAPSKATLLRLGEIKLARGDVDWTFPKTGSYAAGHYDFDKAGMGAELLRLDVVGEGDLRFTDGKSEIPNAHMELPFPFDEVNGDVAFKGDNGAGLRLDALRITSGNLGYGFGKLTLDYSSDPPTWTGTVFFVPGGGDADSSNAYEGIIRIKEGGLDYVKIAARFEPPGKKIYPPFLFMRYAGLSLNISPLEIQGSTILTAGPSVGNRPLVSVGRPFDDYGTVTLSIKHPFEVASDGPLYVLGFKLGNGNLKYRFPGDASFGARAKIGDCSLAGASAEISGFVTVSTTARPAFNAAAKGEACLGPLTVGAEMVLSSVGAAACASFGISDTLSVDAGAGLKWGGDLNVMPVDCDTGPYSATMKAIGSASQAGGRGFPVGAGLKQLNVHVDGSGGLPAPAVTMPNGQVLRMNPGETVTKGANFIGFQDLARNRVTFLVPKPPAGRWTATGEAGGAPIAGLSLARDLPPVRVTGSVRRLPRSARRELRYSVRRIPGQVVTFYEEGAGSIQRLGTAKGTRGALRYTPKAITAGVRKVTAVIDSNGYPRAKLTLASYRVSGPQRPRRARGVRASRTKAGGLLIRWRPGAFAKRQEVRVVLGDGTREIIDVGAKARRAGVAKVLAATTGRVTVTGIAVDGRRGPPQRARVRAQKRTSR